MRILFLTPYAPVPPMFGGALRIYHLLKGLALNNEVTLLTFGGEQEKKLLNNYLGGYLKEFHLVSTTWAWQYKRLAQFYALFMPNSFFSLFSKSDEMQNKINELLQANYYDIVQMEFPIMGNFELNTDAIKILDEHNIEYDNFFGMYKYAGTPVRKLHYFREYKKTKIEEINTCKKMDSICVVSHRDKNILDKEIPNIKKFVIPNGVDVNYFKPSRNEPEANTMVFTGMMGYVPNNDGIQYFLDEIFPEILKEIPNAKIYIVGNKPSKKLLRRASNNIIVTGYVHDVRPYIWRSSVYVVPLRMGGGTRLKVLEALSMRKPVVTTTIGCEGIDVKDDESVLIEDDPKLFAMKTISLLKNLNAHNRLIQNGYDLVHSKYDWETITEKLELAYQTLVNEKLGSTKVQTLSERAS